MIVIQAVRERGSVTVKWEVKENTWGYSAGKFIIRIVKKMSRILISCPLLLLFKVKETSLNRVKIIFFFRVENGTWAFQSEGAPRRGTKNKATQAEETKVEEGSKTENRFVIILVVLSFFQFWVLFQ